MRFFHTSKVTTGPKKSYNALLINALPVVTIVVLALLGWFVVKPIWASYKEKSTAIVKEEQEVTDLKTKRDMLVKLSEPQLAERLIEARKALPEQKNIPGVITGISQLVSENNLTVAALQIKPGKIVSTGQEEVVVKISVVGDIRNLDAMLKRLSQVRRIISVKKVSGSSTLTNGSFVTSLELGVSALPIPDNLLGKSYADPLPDYSEQKQKLVDMLAGFPVYTELSAGSIPIAASASASATPIGTASAKPKPSVF